MTVEELIVELQKHDPKEIIYSYDEDQGICDINVVAWQLDYYAILPKWNTPMPRKLCVLASIDERDRIMDELMPKDILTKIIASWDKKEDLSEECETYWKALSTAQRREIQMDYEYEKDI